MLVLLLLFLPTGGFFTFFVKTFTMCPMIIQNVPMFPRFLFEALFCRSVFFFFFSMQENKKHVACIPNFYKLSLETYNKIDIFGYISRISSIHLLLVFVFYYSTRNYWDAVINETTVVNEMKKKKGKYEEHSQRHSNY